MFTLEAYNAAGEKVKIIAQEVINTDVTGFDTMVGNTVTSIFNPTESGLVLRFPEIWTAYQVGGAYVDFTWDGTNENGQSAGQGIYYIKATVTDNYGHMNTTIKEVQLLRSEKYVRISIYSSSGELVRRIEQGYVPGTEVTLDTPDVIYISGANNAIDIKLGAAGTVQWDGKNSLGVLVNSGIYEVSMELKESTGFTLRSSKTVTVLNENQGPAVSGVKIYPNPVVAYEDDGKTIRVAWTAAGTGKITIRIYNVAAELVAKIEARIEDLFADWDMTAADGARLSAGFYVAEVEAVTTGGKVERYAAKLALIRR